MVLERGPEEHVYGPIMHDKVLSLVSRWQTVTDLVRDACVERGFTVDTVNYLFPHSARYVQAKAVTLNSPITFGGCAQELSNVTPDVVLRLVMNLTIAHHACFQLKFLRTVSSGGMFSQHFHQVIIKELS